MKVIGIYQIINVTNNKRYVGSSTDITGTRWSEHKGHLRNKIHSSAHLQNAWNKYGEEAFIFEIIEKCLFEELSTKEEYWIEKYQSWNRVYGYNIQREINGHKKVSEETKHKLSESLKGHTVSQETRDKQSKTRINLGLAKGANNHFYGKHLTGETNGFYGKYHTEETKEKMRGSNNSQAKLSWKAVKDIRMRWAERNCTQQVLANEYGVTFQMISRIVLFKAWKEEPSIP